MRQLVFLCAMVMGFGVAHAASSPPQVSERDIATLVTDRASVASGQKLGVALRLQLKPGWHTYWQNPGDAGEAPSVKVTLTGGATGAADAIAWGTPVRISDGGLMSYAYLNDTLLPVSIVPKAGNDGLVTVSAHAEWLVCASVCVPEQGDFSLQLPRGDGASSAEAPLFAAQAATQPSPSPFTATYTDDGTLTLRGAGLNPGSVVKAWFMPDDSTAINQVAPQALQVGDHAVSLHFPWAKGYHPGGPLSGIVVLQDKAGAQSALEIHAEPGQPVAVHRTVSDGLGLGRMLVFAFLGGLILNLMPCVFPVLAMKALALARMGGEGRSARLASAAGYGFGVIGTFVALGVGLVALRALGTGLEWGFQFQSPLFVLAVCWLVFAMALNLLGIFEVTAGAVGQDMAPKSGFFGDVLTGVLAVVVATPCTAPFMGAAVAGALAGPVWAAVVVFAGLGFGLAFPYLLLACVPGLARFMPKPGAWMSVLRQALAFPLLLTCVWLAWVLVRQAGPDSIVAVLAGMVALGAAAWAFGASQHAAMVDGPVMRWRAFALLALIGAGLIAGFGVRVQAGPVAADQSDGSEPFTQAALDAARAQGRPVFVDMTASWCITCMVNERVALDTPSVRAAFQSHHVLYLKGDWTNRNDAIGSFLHAHERDGVPLYVYYPANGEGRVLPQVLTPGLVSGVLNGG